jgi:hypothetical protein
MRGDEGGVRALMERRQRPPCLAAAAGGQGAGVRERERQARGASRRRRRRRGVELATRRAPAKLGARLAGAQRRRRDSRAREGVPCWLVPHGPEPRRSGSLPFPIRLHLRSRLDAPAQQQQAAQLCGKLDDASPATRRSFSSLSPLPPPLAPQHGLLQPRRLLRRRRRRGARLARLGHRRALDARRAACMAQGALCTQ